MGINYREIARLKGKEVSNRKIALQLSISRSTVDNVVSQFTDRGIGFHDVSEMTNDEIRALIGKRKTNVRDEVFTLPDYERISKELSKPGVTIQLLWEEYRDECRRSGKQHYQLTQFKKYLHEFLDKSDFTDIINHKAGEKIEVDWAGTRPSWKDPDTGEIIKGYLFVGVLPFSGYAYARVCADMTQYSWIESHIKMFEYFGGVSKILVPDNLKTGVTKHTPDTLILNPTYFELAEHYGAVIVPARVRKPRDKSSAEGSVNLFTTQIIARLRNYQFFTMEEYNKQALIEVDKINQKPFQKKQGSRYSIFVELEKNLLLPLPIHPFVMFSRKVAKVQNNSHVYYQKYYYSVPYSCIGNEVELKIYNDYLEIYQNLDLIATHRIMKDNSTSRYSTDISHLPPDAGKYGDWNKTRYLNWAKTKGPYTHQVIKRIFDGKEVEHQCYRTVHSILKLADSYSDQRLEKSCQLALDRHYVPSYKYIKSILMNNQDWEERTAFQTEKGSRFVRGGSYFGKR